MGNSALRLFTHLCDLQIRDLSNSMYLGNRDLAAVTGLALMSVRAALNQLYSRLDIVLRWGDNKTANRIYDCLWDGKVEEMGGGKIPPPSTGKSGLLVRERAPAPRFRFRYRIRYQRPTTAPPDEAVAELVLKPSDRRAYSAPILKKRFQSSSILLFLMF